MSRQKIEINCDLGEGIVGEEMIFPLIDAASIACGGHFGDEDSIRASLLLARKHQVKVGVHPSYPDPENFGRKSMDISPADLIESVGNQIQLFLGVSTELKLPLDHIKWHGALYNDSAANEALAEVLIDFVAKEYPKTYIFVPPMSQTERFAKAKKLPYRIEVFGDRSYRSDYSLMPRKEKNALLTDPSKVEAHLSSILEKGEIRLQSGEKLKVAADTLCFHGDNPGLLNFLPKIRSRFWS